MVTFPLLLFYKTFTDEEIVKLSKGMGKDNFCNLDSSGADYVRNVSCSKSLHFEDIIAHFHAGQVSWGSNT